VVALEEVLEIVPLAERGQVAVVEHSLEVAEAVFDGPVQGGHGVVGLAEFRVQAGEVVPAPGVGGIAGEVVLELAGALLKIARHVQPRQPLLALAKFLPPGGISAVGDQFLGEFHIAEIRRQHRPGGGPAQTGTLRTSNDDNAKNQQQQPLHSRLPARAFPRTGTCLSRFYDQAARKVRGVSDGKFGKRREVTKPRMAHP